MPPPPSPPPVPLPPCAPAPATGRRRLAHPDMAYCRSVWAAEESSGGDGLDTVLLVAVLAGTLVPLAVIGVVLWWRHRRRVNGTAKA
eukprot:716467-Prymnesium_polylepis.1